jgi:hypothetical protein
MTFMLSLLGGFLMAVLEFMITVAFSTLTWLLRLLWPAWVIIAIVGMLALNAQSAHAGWFDWFWGSDTEQLERSTEIAQEAARVTSASTIATAIAVLTRIARLRSRRMRGLDRHHRQAEHRALQVALQEQLPGGVEFPRGEPLRVERAQRFEDLPRRDRGRQRHDRL